MRAYEVMVILDPNLEERTIEPSLDKYLNVIRKDGGNVENVDVWDVAASPTRSRRTPRALRRHHAPGGAGDGEGVRPSDQPGHSRSSGPRSFAPTPESDVRRHRGRSVPALLERALAIVGVDATPCVATQPRSARETSWQARPSSRWSATSSTTGAALHPLGCGRGQLPDRVDAAHLRPSEQRVEGRRRAVPHLLGVAAGRGERRRVPPARHACRGAGSPEVPPDEPVRARSAPSSRSTSKRSAPP